MTTPRRAGTARLFALFLSLALVAGACGSDDAGTEAPSAPSTTNGPPTTTTEMRPYERAAGPSAGCDAADPALAGSTTDGRFDHADLERVYNLTLPDEPATEPIPLVVNLHGATGRDDSQDAISRFDELATSEGFVLLSPQATDPLRVWEIRPSRDDTTYVLALLDAVESGLCIDRGRVYLTGFSMGAMLATTLSCMQPGRFAGIGAVSGLADVEACQDPARRRTPLIAFHGTEDDKVLADGTYDETVTAVSGLPPGPSREELAVAWADDLGCVGDPTVTDAPPVTSTVFTCPDGAGVEFHLIAGADHHWPGGDQGPVELLTPEGEPDATELIWDFFARQPT